LAPVQRHHGIIAGLAIVQHPLWASLLVPATLVWILGFMGIIMGVVSIVLAFQGGGWGPGILGVISIGAGVLLLERTWPWPCPRSCS
jgi:uncharacterized membrane protein HdeD (DUF308 family)